MNERIDLQVLLAKRRAEQRERGFSTEEFLAQNLKPAHPNMPTHNLDWFKARCPEMIPQYLKGLAAIN